MILPSLLSLLVISTRSYNIYGKIIRSRKKEIIEDREHGKILKKILTKPDGMAVRSKAQ